MELKNFFKNSSNEIYTDNMDLLEHYALVNPLGSPNKLFLKFLKSKSLDIKKDKITKELIEEFEESIDSTNLKLEKIRKEKEIIFKNQNVWINVLNDDEELTGTDLKLNPEDIFIESLNQRIQYTDIYDIDVSPGGWSKNHFTLFTKDGEVIFEINEDRAIALKEILEDNIAHQNYDEISELLDLYTLFEQGKISEEELEVRKAIIYSDDLYCTNCGSKIDFDSAFCTNCGERVLK